MHVPTTRPILHQGLWLAFFAGILIAWAMLYAMAMDAGLDLVGRQVGPGGATMTGLGALASMWALMMAAMMLPSLVPTLRAYDDLPRAAGATRGGWLGLVAGYLGVWIVFAVGIAAVQVLLVSAGLLDELGAATRPAFTGALLVAVGLWQFTRIKEVCHGVCHTPALYFMTRWRRGAGGGLRMGLHLGAFCAACCWGMMALGFVGGTMSLLWMGAATLFMIFEKLPRIGHRLIRPAGIVLCAMGASILARAAFI